ncbi:MAG: hypothetical protein DRN20_00620, partial [Thermoplasmata archaeon]
REEEMRKLKERVKVLGKEAQEAISVRNREIERLRTMLNEKSVVVVATTDDIKIPKNTAVKGGIKTPKNVIVEKNVEIEGGIYAGGDVVVSDDCRLKGEIKSGGSVSIGDKCVVDGEIVAEGEAQIGEECTLSNVRAKGAVTVGKNCKLAKISSESTVSVADNCEIAEGIEYGVTMNLGKGVKVLGPIMARISEEPKKEEKVDTCPVCGTPLDGADTCPKCGAQIGKGRKRKKEKGSK